ncbi:MAG TPA: ATPase, T2SS/T4P/T4SS family, partial [Pyrinomonadaceae bacterium]|nr:ATPase, T2SS/T4P/T4SS family [Pyrinomonadaceae bacterium]
MAKLDELLRLMRQHRASDIHLSSGSAPYLRVHGEMVKMNYREVAHEVCQSLIFQILTDRQKEIFNETLELDFGYPLAEVGRFRVNVFMQRHGIAAVFRLIPEKAQTIEELGLPEQLHDLIDVSEGLVLVTGPTGSGKSTTLYSALKTINS